MEMTYFASWKIDTSDLVVVYVRITPVCLACATRFSIDSMRAALAPVPDDNQTGTALLATPTHQPMERRLPDWAICHWC